MIQIILVVYGLVLFVNALFEKWGLWDKIALLGAVCKHKKIYELAQCRFCLLFHTGWIITLIYCLFNGFEAGFLITPFVVTGLITTKK